MKYVKCIDRFPDAVKEGGIDDDDVLKKALELEKDFFERVKVRINFSILDSQVLA